MLPPLIQRLQHAERLRARRALPVPRAALGDLARRQRGARLALRPQRAARPAPREVCLRKPRGARARASPETVWSRRGAAGLLMRALGAQDAQGAPGAPEQEHFETPAPGRLATFDDTLPPQPRRRPPAADRAPPLGFAKAAPVAT
jgi:hypothetical protein